MDTTTFIYCVREYDMQCGDLRLLATTQSLVVDGDLYYGVSYV